MSSYLTIIEKYVFLW